MEDGLGRDLMNAGRFCFSCEQIFANRKCLEEHACSATSYICSCGTEFTEYRDMQEHSTTHEPGHQVLDHETIKKRRMEKRKAEEEQLKRLETGEVVWKPPKLNTVASGSLPAKPARQVPVMPQVPKQSAQISQVPGLHPSMSQASLPPNRISSNPDVKNIFANVGAPTVDLWTLYQPVVLLPAGRRLNRKRPYSCGKCGQCFITKPSLIAHHSSHVTDKVSGCIGCGLLLSSKKLVPRFHVCNNPHNITKLKIITARPLRHADTNRRLNPNAGAIKATSSLQLKSPNFSAANKGKEAPCVKSKTQNIRTYNQNNQGVCVAPSLQLKSHNSSAYNPAVSFPLKIQSTNPGGFNRSSSKLVVAPSGNMKLPIFSASGVSRKPTKMSSPVNAFTCRVCHIPFETAQLLQRHKCIKAKEFMAQHVRTGSPHYKLKRATPGANPNLAQVNGERKFGIPASANIKKSQVAAIGLNKGQGAVSVGHKTDVDMEDDCYIVESGPDKPAEMIYQVTSSVPIKT